MQHRVHFGRTRINRSHSCFVCTAAGDISSPEADAPWPSLTALGDAGLHRPMRIYVHEGRYTMRKCEREREREKREK